MTRRANQRLVAAWNTPTNSVHEVVKVGTSSAVNFALKSMLGVPAVASTQRIRRTEVNQTSLHYCACCSTGAEFFEEGSYLSTLQEWRKEVFLHLAPPVVFVERD